MTIPTGKKVKSKKGGTYAPVGILMEINGDTAEVEYRQRPGSSREMKTYQLEDLVQVCKETIFRDYSRYECGRPVKEGDLCGVHAGAIKRAEALRAKAAEEQKLRERKRADDAARLKALEAKIRDKGWHEFIKVRNASAGTIELRWDDLIDLITKA